MGVVAVQFGYIGLRLCERFGRTGLLMIGLLGAINISFYEEMARRIHWWQYKYAEALREFDYLISLHPRNVTLARALSDRAWFRATCPNASFLNGQQAVKDAKAACSIMVWKDEHMIDTLAVAYAEIGDFDSAVQYAAQALAVKGVSPDSTNLFQKYLALFQHRKPIRL